MDENPSGCPWCVERERRIEGLEMLASEKDKRLGELEAENAQITKMHERIIAWPPEDVQRAYAVILQGAARLAHVSPDGNMGIAVRDAVDSIQKHIAQQEAELDRLHSDTKSDYKKGGD